MRPGLPSRIIEIRSLLGQRRGIGYGLLVFASIIPLVASAETKWEVTPYRVVACIAVVNDGDWTAPEQERLRDEVAELAAAELGAAWRFSATSPSEALRGELLTRCIDVTAEKVLALDTRSSACDKWIMAVIERSAAGDLISVRELDLATRQLGPVLARTSPQRRQLASCVLELLLAAFSPLVELDRATGDKITGRLRAAALIDDPQSSLLVGSGTPLLPVLRINDRLGRAASDQISVIPLTLLSVESYSAGTVTCDIHAASRHRLGARASLRLSRFGLAVRAPQRATCIVLQSDGQPSLPLADYELIDGEEAKSVGRTDTSGAIEVSPDDRPWRLVYVRHGDQLLARLPIITGYQQEVVVSLASSDVRLRAEGFVAALKQEVVDTVARRQILSARLRQRLAAKQFDHARAVLDELQRLTDVDEFDQRLQTARTKLVGDNARAQQHIDRLFHETRQSLARYLDPGEIKRLETQLAEARRTR